NRSFRPPPTYETGNDKFDDQGGKIKEITTWHDPYALLTDESELSEEVGSRKENYYNADNISNLDDAKEEEEEALKLHKKRINGESLEFSMVFIHYNLIDLIPHIQQYELISS
ncbi:12272_t:CDS:2, partial [Racocetra fulgida]